MLKFLRFMDGNIIELGIIYKEIYAINIKEISFLVKYSTMGEIIEQLSEEEIKKLKNFIKKDINTDILKKLEDLKILSPIEKTSNDIICVGLNYTEHIKEMREAPLKETIYFSKRANIINATLQEINYDFLQDQSLDYEVELAVIIGKRGKNIKKAEVKDHIFGFTILNDLSARTLQKKHKQWFKGKSLDGLLSIGPVIVHKSSLDFPLELEIRSFVNGDIRQISNTKNMLKNINDIIEDISKNLTLEIGDIISTGTCSGVGAGFIPPRYLKDGDIIECSIEKIGILKNKIRSL